MIKITDRDEKIKQFVQNTGCCDTNTIANIFFNGGIRNCQKRMKLLTENGFIKVFRPSIFEQNIFYVKIKPRNWKHKIVFSQLIGELHKLNVEILKYKTPYKINDCIADGIVVIRIDNEIRIFYVEVELSKKLNTDKYIKLHYERAYKEAGLPFEPSILVITDKNINTDNTVLDIRKVNLNFEGLLEVIK